MERKAERSVKMLLKVLFLAEFVAIAVASTSEASRTENADNQRESRQASRTDTDQVWWNGLDRVPDNSALRTADDPLIAREFREQKDPAFARPEELPVGQAGPAAATGLRSNADAPGTPGPGDLDGLARNVPPGSPSDPMVARGLGATPAGLSNPQRFTNDPSLLRATDQTGRILQLPENLRPRVFNNAPRTKTWPAGPLGLRGKSVFLSGNKDPRINAGLVPPQVPISGPTAQRYIDPSLARPSPVPAGLVDPRLMYNPTGFFGFLPGPGDLSAFHNRHKNPVSSALIGPNGPLETRPYDPAWNSNRRFVKPNPAIRQDPNHLLYSSPHLPYQQPHHMGWHSPGLFSSRHTMSDKIRFLLREWLKRNIEMF